MPELKRGAEDYEEYEAKGPDGSTRQSWRPSNGKLNLVRGLDARPQIIVTNRHLHELSDEAWAAVKRSNYPAWLFRHGGQIAEIGRDEEDRPVIVHLSLAGLRGRLDRSAVWLRETKQGLKPARPPTDVVEDLLALDNTLPVLRGITGTPVFTADGSLVTQIGYQLKTRLFYRPVGDRLPDIPKKPGAQDVELAKGLILKEWFHDFPFADDSSRANAVAAALTPALRELIAGPTPLFTIDSPQR